MKVMVLIAGVLDPKWPVAPADGGLPERSGDRLLLSPFDEAALEIALKIRDATPDTDIHAVVAGGAEAEKLARGVCALNIPHVATLALPSAWDQASVAGVLAKAAEDADLVLIGREFGDCDDGLVPPMLAGILGRSFFGRAQAVDASAGLRLMREAALDEEWLSVGGGLVVSVTNDRRNRLRKPLMKNVMLARQARIDAIENTGPIMAADGLLLARGFELAGTRMTTDCRMIGGDVQEQARALAAILCGERI
ncbi:electron transfer flavoprotein subunit beta/FixA family protein [Sphingobium estronivorans]|uniref:electron transfer flavoprotein subunit beta/FixA family protein n=1 Tax=Sphingobium estronivorans TaxID=1577690 RepID=UPI00123B1F72|nr:electron transfer flavoprotein subunit beta [Sphingobium estronivorans]